MRVIAASPYQSPKLLGTTHKQGNRRHHTPPPVRSGATPWWVGLSRYRAVSDLRRPPLSHFEYTHLSRHLFLVIIYTHDDIHTPEVHNVSQHRQRLKDWATDIGNMEKKWQKWTRRSERYAWGQAYRRTDRINSPAYAIYQLLTHLLLCLSFCLPLSIHHSYQS